MARGRRSFGRGLANAGVIDDEFYRTHRVGLNAATEFRPRLGVMQRYQLSRQMAYKQGIHALIGHYRL